VRVGEAGAVPSLLAPSPPTAWYGALIGSYLTGVAGVTALARRRGPAPAVRPGDVALLAAATNKLARLGTQEKVTAPLRAPFTDRIEGPDEVTEAPKPAGARRAIGELVTCPFCLSVWIATALTAAFVLAPRPTRIVVASLAAMTGSDFLQRAWSRLAPT
jgi:hypothetical protein